MRAIWDIANDINHDWKSVHYTAKPYLSAMFTVEKMTDHYGLDSAHSIVIYFLSNASAWRGPVAKAIKAELKEMLKGAK